MSFEAALAQEINRLRDRLAMLTRLGTSVRPPKSGRTRKSRRRSSAKVRAQRVLQGRYMGSVRALGSAAKKRVQAIREKSGYLKAIAAAKRAAKGQAGRTTQPAQPRTRRRGKRSTSASKAPKQRAAAS